MHRLKNRFRGERALILMGGPSILENRHDLARLATKGFVVFLESKALTRRFLDMGLKPDFYLMFFPEKSKGTSFHNVVHQSLLNNFDIAPLVRDERLAEVHHLRGNVDSYFIPGKQNIAHKRLLWRPDVYLPGSPFDLLAQLPGMGLISMASAHAAMVKQQRFSQPQYFFDVDDSADNFSMERYYNPDVVEERLVLHGSRLTNSAAIALYPLLRFMGFSRGYFLGSDQSMLGSMEHAAPYTFRSMDHFRIFFEKARRTFGTHFPSSDRREALEDIRIRVREDKFSALSSAFFYDSLKALALGKTAFSRPRSEMRAARMLMSAAAGIEFVNVYSPYRYARPVEGVRNIDFEQLAFE